MPPAEASTVQPDSEEQCRPEPEPDESQVDSTTCRTSLCLTWSMDFT